METRVYTEENDIPVAAASLRLGGLVAVPTETVYGLAGNGLDERAVHGIYGRCPLHRARGQGHRRAALPGAPAHALAA